MSKPNPTEGLPIDPLDQLRTMREAARILNVGYHNIRGLVRSGRIPTYTVGNTRIWVTLRDILAAASEGGSTAFRPFLDDGKTAN